jgi:toxin-antitoxin system PIN domain toxin
LILVDVNVLVYAFDLRAVDHQRYGSWLEGTLASDELVGVSDLVLSAFTRIVTHPRILVRPATIESALAFANQVRDAPATVVVSPGDRHWSIFERLCRSVGAKGNLVADAFHAALAIESGAEMITADRDFSRFPGLRWRHPLDSLADRP